jgi:DegV family protein with EDD domain
MVKIVTDSTGYLPAELQAELDIKVVPLNVHFGEQTFQDGVDLTNDEFYTMLAGAPELPTTSQPSPGQFRDVFSELAEAGHEVICLTISSKMSGTYLSAVEASRMLPDARIVVIDTLFVAGALGMMTLTAARMAAEGFSIDQIVDRMEQMQQDIRIHFLVDTLEYLQKGGRIGTASALIGTLLKVKPILTVRDGIVQPLDKVRSTRKAIARLVDELSSSVAPDQPVEVIVMNARSPEIAEQIEAGLRQNMRCEKVIWAEIGAVVGTHAGPSVVGGVICPTAWPIPVPVIQERTAKVDSPT